MRGVHIFVLPIRMQPGGKIFVLSHSYLILLKEIKISAFLVALASQFTTFLLLYFNLRHARKFLLSYD